MLRPPSVEPAPTPPATPGGRRAVLVVAVAVAVVAGALAGAFPRWRARVALTAERRELAVAVVRVVSPKPGKPATPPAFPAEIKPLLEASIVARASGYVRRWTTDIGGHVAAGSLLAELESPELDQELARGRQEAAQAEAALALAANTAGRYQGLAGTPSVSDQEVAERGGDLAVKTAARDAALANVRRLEQLRAFTLIRSPFAGIVTSRRVDVGDLVTGGGGRELFRVVQAGTLRVSLRVPQAWAAGVAAGQPAEVLLPELGGKALPAVVARSAGALSPESRTLLVELELANALGDILPGGYAEARLLGGRRPAPLTLPANTLLFREEGPRVGVVGKDGRVELRSVRLGRDFGRTVELLSGVSAGDAVILNHSDALAAGAVVRIAAEPAAEGGR